MKKEKMFEFEEILQQISNKTLKEVKLIFFELNDTDVERLAALLPQSQVTSLNLGHNEINEAGAAALAAALPQSLVTNLNLEHNEIKEAGTTALAAALPQSQITSLNLNTNEIGWAGAVALAKVLPKIKVTNLALGNNGIGNGGVDALSKVLQKSKVTSLNLRNNEIGATGAAALAKVLPKSKVTSLNLELNRIGEAGVAALVKALPKSRVTNIALKWNEISAVGVAALAKVLPKSKVTSIALGGYEIGEAEVVTLANVLPKSKVTSLDLGWNKIGVFGAITLAKVLPQSQVTILDLTDNKIGDAGVVSLAKLLPQSLVTGLKLSSNKIGDAGMASLATVLPQSQITSLDLSNNEIGVVGAIVLAAVLPQSQVTNLKLGNNKIGEAGAIALAKVLPQSQVTSLDLWGDEIGEAGAASLAEALPQSLVTSLKLSSNKIGKVGAAALAKVLPKSKVTSLDLGWNEIDEAGAAALAKVLPQSQVTSLDLRDNRIWASSLVTVLPQSQITSLNLSNNKISEAEAIALAKVLPQSQITSLNLSNNKIGNAGAIALVAVLPQSKVTSLNLGDNEIWKAGIAALIAVLPQSKITSLGLRDNGIGEAGAASLAAALPQSQVTILDLRDNKNKISEAGTTALFTSLKKNYVITKIDGIEFNAEQEKIATSHFEVNKLLNAKVEADNSNIELVHELVSTALRHINQPQLLDDPTFEKPKRLLLRAAELGSVQALYHLGNLYLNELKDFNLATQYYLQAANNGHDISKLCLELLAKDKTPDALQLGALNINMPRRFSLNTKEQMSETRDEVIANLKEANLLISKTGISLHALAQLTKIKASASVYVALKDYEPTESGHLHFSAGQVLYIPYDGDVIQGLQEDVALYTKALKNCFIPYNRDKQGKKRADEGIIAPEMLFNDYLQQKPREDWTAEEVCNAIIIPRTKPSKEGEVGKAYIDTLPEACRGKPFEGYIFSYARSTKFRDILQTLNERFKEQDPNEVFIWIDIAGVNQHAWLKMKSDEIGKILEENLTQLFTHISEGRLIHFDKASPTNLTRSWCLVELLACLKAQQHTVAQTEICMTADVQAEVLAQDTMEMLNSVDSSKAQCFNEQDRIAINAQIKRDLIRDGETDIVMEEAYERLNNVVKSWLVTKFLPDFINVKTLEQEAAVAQQYSSEQRPKQMTFGYDRSKSKSLGNSKATEQTRDESRVKQKNQCVIW